MIYTSDIAAKKINFSGGVFQPLVELFYICCNVRVIDNRVLCCYNEINIIKLYF